MLETLQLILTQAAGQLRYEMTTYMPLVLAAMTILLLAFVCAAAGALGVESHLQGDRVRPLAAVFGSFQRHRAIPQSAATRIVGQIAFWLILAVGLVTALNALNTKWTSAIAESLLFFFPKLAAGAALLMGGLMLAYYLARGTLVWAVNEELPAPRRLAMAVRVVVLLVTIVAVADYLNFARGCLLSAFILILGGAVLAGSLALGLGGRDAVADTFGDAAAGGGGAERAVRVESSVSLNVTYGN